MKPNHVRFLAGLRRLRGDDRGIAIAVVLLVGGVLVVMTSLVIARSLRQAGTTHLDAQWERALNVTEAGADYAVNEKNADPLFFAGDDIPVTADRAEERLWAVTEAAGQPTVVTPEGEFAFLVPYNEPVIYAVGYVPGRDAPGVRVRVIRREYAPVRYVAEIAVLVGGATDILANAAVLGAGADVHSNGDVTLGNNVQVDGCVTSATSTIAADPPCPASPVAPVWIPPVRVRSYYEYATLALCPDGTLRGGPSHATLPDPTPRTPCDAADSIVQDNDWKYLANKNTWTVKGDGEGVFYAYRTNIEATLGKLPQNKKVRASLFAETGDLSCGVEFGGRITLSAGAFIQYHSSLEEFETAIIAEGDINYSGGAVVQGAVFAREQINYAGGPESWGPVLAADECDTPFSPVSTTTITGGAVVNYGGPIETLFLAGIRATDWDEL
jgi:hypothetical protein